MCQCVRCDVGCDDEGGMGMGGCGVRVMGQLCRVRVRVMYDAVRW